MTTVDFGLGPQCPGRPETMLGNEPPLVSQLLPAERCFDVCIFDEASQVTPAGAAVQ